MKHLVLRLDTLPLYITPNHGFIAVASYRADEETTCPKSTPPKALLDLRQPTEDFARRDAFDRSRDPGWAIGRYRLDQEMHMIVVGADLQKRDFVPVGDVQANIA